jgi:ACS family hexuronate transporter-like MFS transporter
MHYGYIAAAFQFAYAFGYLFGGRLMDKWGVKKGLPIFVSVWSAAAMAHGLCTFLDKTAEFRVSLPWFSWAEGGFIIATLAMPMTAAGFMFARILLGLSEGGNFPGAIRAVAEWFPIKERALATGIFNAGTNVGAVICPVAVPWIFGHMGWEATFYITGGVGFLWLIGWLLVYDNPETHKRLSEGERAYIREGKPAVETVPPRVPWLSLLGYRRCGPTSWPACSATPPGASTSSSSPTSSPRSSVFHWRRSATGRAASTSSPQWVAWRAAGWRAS